MPVMPSAAGIVDDGRIVVATELDFRILDLDSGKSLIHVRLPDDPAVRSNDGRVHPSGAFWVGTMPKDGRSKPGDIWRLLEGELTRMIEGVMIPNSICFSADGCSAYFTDTPTRVIWRVPTDPRTGMVIGEREAFVELGSDDAGGPDGSVVDADGNLWNARWGGAALDVYAPDGVRIHTYDLPATQPTCPAFVGVELDQIVTTTATAGLSNADRKEADGAVLQVHVPVTGRPEPLARP